MNIDSANLKSTSSSISILSSLFNSMQFEFNGLIFSLKQKLSKQHCLILSYDDLLNDLEVSMSQVAVWLGVPDHACLRCSTILGMQSGNNSVYKLSGGQRSGGGQKKFLQYSYRIERFSIEYLHSDFIRTVGYQEEFSSQYSGFIYKILGVMSLLVPFKNEIGGGCF